mmetsp:Transcript_13211/g.45690  ORF Transcript_13211/g.45690 Transcript_13211/m.45690 type:complete len:400 (-) Transcript_13211:139-1338(-)
MGAADAGARHQSAAMVLIGSQQGEGRIPGYQGYIPGMKNHLIGKRYTEATRVAADCQGVLEHGSNPSGMQVLVDNRPQGRNFLYAQVAESGPKSEPVLAPAHVGKRRPLLNEALGETDFRLMKTVIGGQRNNPMKLTKTASLPALPYTAKKFFTGQEQPEAPELSKGKLPGYTGHQHGAQHVYAQSYGSTTRCLAEGQEDDMRDRSLKFLHYGEERPSGDSLQEKHRIPGYQGYIPGKDNHIYGKTYGDSTNLAPLAEDTMKTGGNASGLEELVDFRPQGGVDLYAQAIDPFPQAEKEKLKVRVSKGVVRTVYHEKGKDHKYREKLTDDIREVREAKHRVVGYTGHVHGCQHVYAQSYGKMTRQLHGGAENLTEPDTKDELLYYRDDRPHQTVKYARNL